MAGAPLHQGATADDSMRSFKKYMYDELCAKTPLNKSVNGVLLKIVSGAKQYSHDCVQRLLRDELMAALEALEEAFGQVTPAAGTTAAWSTAAAATGLRAGKIYFYKEKKRKRQLRLSRRGFGGPAGCPWA